MKNIRLCAALLIAALILPMLTGCSLWTLDERLDNMEDALENRLDAIEDAMENKAGNIEDKVEPSPRNAATPTDPPAPTPAPDPTEAPAEAPRQIPAAALTREEAEAIALAHAGFTADQITRLRTEYDWDDRVPHYDVEFHQGYWEYEYEIHAETGAIRSVEKDD